MRKLLFILIVLAFLLLLVTLNKHATKGNPADTMNTPNTTESNIKITPISHASMVLGWNNRVIYTDPVGIEGFADQPEPDVILLTDIHGDHLDLPTLQAVTKDKTTLLVPQAVAEKIANQVPGKVIVMKNGETITQQGLAIEAIPMYNLPESATSYHTKGRGNGYVVESEGKRIYISGDTSDIPEMRNLKNIDIAFVCMNLPYTMSVDSAAQGVLAFAPKQVYPYHYKGSDVNKFKDLVNAGNPNIEVKLLNWYPDAQ